MNRNNSSVIFTAAICIGLIALLLCLFFDMTSGTEEPKKQKEISVILYYVGNGGWESLQEGMKQAEDDFAVNINYAMMREDADGKEQLEIVEREIKNGAEGIILAVCDYEAIYDELERISNSVPLIAVESGVGDSMLSLISADNYEMGKRLGEEILKDFTGKENLTVALACENVNRDSVQQREQGFRDALDGKAKIISLEAVINGENSDAAAALQKESLLALAERTDAALNDTKKYGIGNTSSIVAALDQDKIEKLIFQNEFNMGYLAVDSLMKMIAGDAGKGEKSIDYYCVSREELYGTQYEQLLFPIVE